MAPSWARRALWAWLWALLVLAVPSHTTSDDGKDKLRGLLQQAAGVYTDPQRQAGLERIVVVTGCNHGFLNHLLNFRCFADRLGMKFLVVAMDEKANTYLTKHTKMLTYYMPTGADNTSASVTSDSVTFRSKQFNLITARKKEAVHDILVLGYDVLFSDTDVAMLRDPLPYLLWKNVDYVHSLNAVCRREETWDLQKSKEEGNTGFYFVRSTPRTIKLWADAFAAVPKHRGLDDQAVFWYVIRRSVDPPIYPLGRCRHVPDGEALKVPVPAIGKESKIVPMKAGAGGPLVTCVLDSCVFSSGMISRLYLPEYTYEFLMENLAHRNETICTLHANYIKKGNLAKAVRMAEHGLWLSGQPDATDKKKLVGTCAPYVPRGSNATSSGTGKGGKTGRGRRRRR